MTKPTGAEIAKSLGLLQMEAGQFVPFQRIYAANQVESLLEAGVEVFGVLDNQGCGFSREKWNQDTHTGLVIGLRPIVKEPVKVKFEDLVFQDGDCGVITAPEIRKFIGKRVKVTVEEIP